MSVSIIIITLNEEKYLPKLLRDLSEQTAPDSIGEILVVDGGSTDDTKGAAEKFTSKLPVRFIKAPKKVGRLKKTMASSKLPMTIYYF